MRARREPDRRWEVRPRRRPVVLALLASCLLAGIGMWLGGLAGTLALICFAATAGVAAVELWRSRPVLVVGATGLQLRTPAGERVIAWQEIEAVTLWTALGANSTTEDRLAVVFAVCDDRAEQALAVAPVAVTETEWDGGRGARAVAVRSRLETRDLLTRTSIDSFVVSDAVSLLHCTLDVWELRALFMSYGVSAPIVDRRR